MAQYNLSLKIASFFSGCGGLDLGFKQAGFDVVWANEYDESIHHTYELNHPDTFLCKKDIRDIIPDEIPECDGFIGGPPCQSWSLGGKMKGLDDDRGKLFLTYISIIKIKKPKFFVIENVEGIVSDKHFSVFKSFIEQLGNSGYNVYYELLDAVNYRIPQNRKRVFIVGFRNDIRCSFEFPKHTTKQPITLRQAISDINAEPQKYNCDVSNLFPNGRFYNHDCYIGPFDSKFMARNRVRSWEEPSFTIQAQAKNCPLHPQAPKMTYVNSTTREFVKGFEHLYRRLSVRECARIQSFPDTFKFIYRKITDGYKMVGNAVPPRLAFQLAVSLKESLCNISNEEKIYALVGYFKDDNHLNKILANNLYYVRTGFCRGSFKMPEGIKPQILILHNKRRKIYFKLSIDTPKNINVEDLREMGFNPSGLNYLGFDIIQKIDENDIFNLNKLKLKTTRDKVIPYLIELPDN